MSVSQNAYARVWKSTKRRVDAAWLTFVVPRLPTGSTMAFFYATIQVTLFYNYEPLLGMSEFTWRCVVILVYLIYAASAFPFAPINFGNIHNRILGFGPSTRAATFANASYRSSRSKVASVLRPSSHPSFHPLSAKACQACANISTKDLQEMRRIHQRSKSVIDGFFPGWSTDDYEAVQPDVSGESMLETGTRIIDSFDKASVDLDTIKSKYAFGPRVRHCKPCNTCRFCYTHHCVFVGTCITGSTYPMYICYIVTSALLMALATSTIIATLLPALWTTTIVMSAPIDAAIISLCIQLILALFTTSFLWMLVSEHSLLLAGNVEFGDIFRYRAIGMEAQRHASDFRGPFGVLIGTYINIRWRIWQGPLLAQQSSVSVITETNQQIRMPKSPGAILKMTREVLYTCACFLVPCFWYVSGEFDQHNRKEIVAKAYVTTDLTKWTLEATAEARRAFVNESSFLYPHPA